MSEKNNLFWKHNCENNKKKMMPTKRQGSRNQNEGEVASLKIFLEPKAVKTGKDELISPKIINSHLENSKLPIIERGVRAQTSYYRETRPRKDTEVQSRKNNSIGQGEKLLTTVLPPK